MLRVLAATLAVSLLVVLPSGGRAADGIRVTGPVTHQNLSVYFVRGPSAGGAVPLTLAEALAKGAVKVHETGNVNELFIENLGRDEVFVHSGDIVKGGQQDRVLTISLVVPPKSGRIPIAAFCVEQGRWSARGREDVKTFASAAAIVPSRDAKLALRNFSLAMAAPEPEPGRPREGADTSSRQKEVWDAVSATQRKLTDNIGAPVAAPQSQSSLQLSLENEKLKGAQEAYLKALQPAGEADADVIGYVFAINGRINSAEVYPSNALFKKLWPKLIAANATEAIGERAASVSSPPAVDAVQAFLAAADKGKSSDKPLPVKNVVTERVAEGALSFETRGASGAWAHRSYLAK